MHNYIPEALSVVYLRFTALLRECSRTQSEIQSAMTSDQVGAAAPQLWRHADDLRHDPHISRPPKKSPKQTTRKAGSAPPSYVESPRSQDPGSMTLWRQLLQRVRRITQSLVSYAIPSVRIAYAFPTSLPSSSLAAFNRRAI